MAASLLAQETLSQLPQGWRDGQGTTKPGLLLASPLQLREGPELQDTVPRPSSPAEAQLRQQVGVAGNQLPCVEPPVRGRGGHASSGPHCAELGATGSSTKGLTKTEPRARGLGLGHLGDVGKQLQVLVPGSTAQGRCQDEAHEEQSWGQCVPGRVWCLSPSDGSPWPITHCPACRAVLPHYIVAEFSLVSVDITRPPGPSSR